MSCELREVFEQSSKSSVREMPEKLCPIVMAWSENIKTIVKGGAFVQDSLPSEDKYARKKWPCVKNASGKQCTVIKN